MELRKIVGFFFVLSFGNDFESVVQFLNWERFEVE